MTSFDIMPGDAASTVILHVPHSATHIPDDVRAGILLDDDALADELRAITDADPDTVAERAADAARLRPWLFVNRTSRLVVDPERFPDEREELNERGMGAVYERTTDQRVLRTPNGDQRNELLDRFFHPYAAAFTQLVDARLATCGAVTIIDVHSYPVVKLDYELHDGPRPEVRIGTDGFHTAQALIEAASTAMRATAPTGEVVLDSPFAGCYVPLKHYRTTAAVQGVMLEVRRDVVATRTPELGEATARLVDEIDGWVSSTRARARRSSGPR